MSSISSVAPPSAAASAVSNSAAQSSSAVVPKDVKSAVAQANVASNASQLSRAALKEATETLSQTAQEALRGDHQAQRLEQRHQAKSGTSQATASKAELNSSRISIKA